MSLVSVRLKQYQLMTFNFISESADVAYGLAFD